MLPVLYVKYLLTGKAAAIMYYVFVYCELTLLIPIIDKLAKSKYRYLGLLISPIEIIFMRLLPLVCGYELNKYVAIIKGVYCFGWFVYYYLGYMIGNGIIKVKLSMPMLWIILGGYSTAGIGRILVFVNGRSELWNTIKINFSFNRRNFCNACF
jgi:surface polysaccharide O-acyltransferase-like enzyme